MLHLTNDRPNCSGLAVAFNFLCVLLGLLYEGRHLSLSVRRKITVNVFYSTFTDVFKKLSRFYVFWKERFFIYGPKHPLPQLRPSLKSKQNSTKCRSIRPGSG